MFMAFAFASPCRISDDLPSAASGQKSGPSASRFVLLAVSTNHLRSAYTCFNCSTSFEHSGIRILLKLCSFNATLWTMYEVSFRHHVGRINPHTLASADAGILSHLQYQHQSRLVSRLLYPSTPNLRRYLGACLSMFRTDPVGGLPYSMRHTYGIQSGMSWRLYSRSSLDTLSCTATRVASYDSVSHNHDAFNSFQPEVFAVT
jgi:hypothetical protein